MISCKLRSVTVRRLALVLAGLVALIAVHAARADDDPPGPPSDPGPGYEGILTNPTLPSNYVIDQSTRPWGVLSVYNAPELKMGQSFRPALDKIDWIAFVFQNSTQPTWPETPGPGLLQISLYSALNVTTSALSGLLGVTDTVSIPSDTIAWLTFRFPTTVSVTPGAELFALVQNVGDGYPSWVGGRSNNVYDRGNTFGYLLNTFTGEYQRQNWSNHDLIFAEGVLTPVPEPAAAVLMICGIAVVGLATLRRRSPIAADGRRV